jgi:hypothetical protein
MTATQFPCRAIAVDGEVRAEVVGDAGVDGGGTALGIQAEIPQDAWLSLAQGARLVAKDPRTTRETTFLGRARARPCVGRREESWIAAGSFMSVAGAGETPGAEEWVVTPLAVVRYAAATLRVEVGFRDTTVAVGEGVALLWLTDDARVHGSKQPVGDAASAAPIDEEGWKRLSGGTVTIAAAHPPLDLSAARTAVDRCASLAARARSLAAELLSPRAGQSPGASTISDQVTTRRLARAACAAAELRARLLPPIPGREDLSARVAGADSAWLTLPVPAPGP